MSIKIDLLGESTSFDVKNHMLKVNNFVTIEINDIEIDMSMKDFKELLTEGEQAVLNYDETRKGLKEKIEELEEIIETLQEQVSA